VHSFLTAGILFGASALASAQAKVERVMIRIDPEIRHQTLEGFGASGAWTSQLYHDWTPAVRRQAVSWLFTDAGAGLSIWRYNIGAGAGDEIRDPTRRARSVEIEPGSRRYDLSRDEAALDMVRAARDAGVSRVVLFAVSAPPHMTVSGRVSGGENGSPNLRDDAIDSFSDYLIDISIKIRDELRLNDVRLSPMNEPQWSWGKEGNQRQEGCHMLPDQMAHLYQAVARRLADRAPGILMEGPEGGAWGGTTFDYIDAFKDDPLVMRQLGALAIHSYWSNDNHRREFMKKYREAGLTIPINQSEYCIMRWGRHDDMEGAFKLFDTMHSDLTICNAVSWTWWLAISNYDYGDGLIYLEKDGTISASKRLWVMGHFSRFIKPGAVRVEATAAQQDLNVTAYRSADGKSIISVLGNRGEAAIDVGITNAALATTSQLYVTGEQSNLVRQDVSTTHFTLPARTIATLVTPLKTAN
jgi:O-glycosyl hydrolase